MAPRPRRITLAVVAALAFGAPAAAQACPEQPLTHTFLPWADPAFYTVAPGGELESGAGWTLEDGAAVVAGNEPYFVGDHGDRRALSLPAGATATSAPMCVGVEHPTLRFFARNTGSPLAPLAVSVVVGGSELPIGLVAGGPAWRPTVPLPLLANLLAVLGEQQVAFRFAARGDGGDWSIDDVYVDPYRKG